LRRSSASSVPRPRGTGCTMPFTRDRWSHGLYAPVLSSMVVKRDSCVLYPAVLVAWSAMSFMLLC
jgi:hypothetical protein